MRKLNYGYSINDRAEWADANRRDNKVPDSELEDWDITVGDGVE